MSESRAAWSRSLAVAQVVVNDGRVCRGQPIQKAQATPFRSEAAAGGGTAQPGKILIRWIKWQRQVPLGHLGPAALGIVQDPVKGSLYRRLPACRQIGAERLHLIDSHPGPAPGGAKTSIPPSPQEGRTRTADGFSRHSSIETTCPMSPGSFRVHSTRVTSALEELAELTDG